MRNKLIYIISAIMIFVSIYEITNTYGLFETEKTLIAKPEIATWNIYINETNINTTNTFNITNFISENTKVAPGKIAPGTIGYFDIIIDPRDTNVSIRYDISFDFSQLNSSFSIDSIEQISGSPVIRTDELTYTNIIPVNEQTNRINQIRVHIRWNNNEENNEVDTEIGMIYDNSLDIPISIEVSQYLNEIIEPYVE